MAREGLPGGPVDHLTGLPISSNDAGQQDAAAAPELDSTEFEFPPESDKLAKQGSLFYPVLSHHCCIYIADDEDYQRASEILIKLGATRQPTISATEAEWINRWATVLQCSPRCWWPCTSGKIRGTEQRRSRSIAKATGFA